jgi:hypothetical protein
VSIDSALRIPPALPARLTRLTWKANKPEPNEVVLIVRDVPVAVSRTAGLGIVVPRAAEYDPKCALHHNAPTQDEKRLANGFMMVRNFKFYLMNIGRKKQL